MYLFAKGGLNNQVANKVFNFAKILSRYIYSYTRNI